MTATTPKTSTLTVTDVDNTDREALAAFTAHPAVSLTGNSIKATVAGVKLMIEYERESHAVQNFFEFCIDGFKAVVLPILSLLWVAIVTGFEFARNPETKDYIVARYEALKVWFSPKFGDEYAADSDQLEIL